jgi:hypothetical protein
MNRLALGLVLFALALVPSPAPAEFIDLTGWSEVTLDLPGGQGQGHWVLSDTNTTATQTINADPSFFLNNTPQSSYTMNGTWRVTTGSDDDLIGFAFGYQDPGHCYILDWKQAAQSLGGYGFRDEGFCVRKLHGEQSELTISDYWALLPDDPQYTILATNVGSTAGWQENVLYNFTLVFNPGQFTITVKRDQTVLWEETINDLTYSGGQFAFYNYSQSNVEYSGFTQNVYPQCDAGGPYTGNIDGALSFDGSGSQDSDGEVVSWSWAFGDGTFADGVTPQHLYANSGTYNVRLCVTDDGGLESCCETIADIAAASAVPEPAMAEPTTWGRIKYRYR